jgi:hypothetical protein
MRTCDCGIPNRANYYVNVILGRDIPGGTETTETYIYVCTGHFVEAGMDERVSAVNTRKLLNWDGHEDWDILESTAQKLR